MDSDEKIDLVSELVGLEGQRDALREALDGLHYACVMQSCRGANHVPTKRALQEAMNKARTALKATEEQP